MHAFSNEFFTIVFGDSPIIATAIHAGSILSPKLLKLCKLNKSERLREEDPFTDQFINKIPNKIIVHRSRFECDLNRPLEKSVYLTSKDAWGLEVWNETLSFEEVQQCYDYHSHFYRHLYQVYADLIARFGKIVILDIHSYNYRRSGPNTKPSPESTHPQINIGTGTMDREYWAPLVDNFIDFLKSNQINNEYLNVRENLIFQGGFHSLWTHQTFPGKACAIAVEFKKFFMDEWSGTPHKPTINSICSLLSDCVSMLESTLMRFNNGFAKAS
jgi:hypothetical protein